MVLVLQFGDFLYLGALQLLDLICGSLYGLCAIGIWYLVFIFGICEPLVRIWFFGFIFVGESYLGVFEIWFFKSASTPIYIIPIFL